MSLSKQLYIIISFIFLMIFTGNFLISVKNTKEYLQIESLTKAQDTATSLGMSLKSLLKDKNNPEIESIINAISNSGFYKEIRLEDANFIIKESEIIKASKNLDDKLWEVSSIKIDEKIGKIEVTTLRVDFEKELLSLEDENSQNENKTLKNPSENIYTFIPNSQIKGEKSLTFDITAKNIEGIEVNTTATLNLNKTLFQASREVKFDWVPSWFIKIIPIELEEKMSEISNGWQTTAIIYVSANPG
mgnify:FL=1